jgi:hypothetical protein
MAEPSELNGTRLGQSVATWGHPHVPGARLTAQDLHHEYSLSLLNRTTAYSICELCMST